MQGKSGGAPMWFVAVHWVCRSWGFLGGAGQGHPTTCVLPWATLTKLKSNLRWLLVSLGLEIPKYNQAVNLG